MKHTQGQTDRLTSGNTVWMVEKKLQKAKKLWQNLCHFGNRTQGNARKWRIFFQILLWFFSLFTHLHLSLSRGTAGHHSYLYSMGNSVDTADNRKIAFFQFIRKKSFFQFYFHQKFFSRSDLIAVNAKLLFLQKNVPRWSFPCGFSLENIAKKHH